MTESNQDFNPASRPADEPGLIARVKASDMEAYHVLYLRYQPVLFRMAVYRLRREDLAEDLVQETFLKLWEKRNTLQTRTSFFSYLWTICRNRMKDMARHNQSVERHRTHMQTTGEKSTPSPEHEIHAKILEEHIHNMVNQHLPEKCRIIFILNRIEDKTNAEIAELLGITKKTVENQMNHALKILRNKCADYL